MSNVHCHNFVHFVKVKRPEACGGIVINITYNQSIAGLLGTLDVLYYAGSLRAPTFRIIVCKMDFSPFVNFNISHVNYPFILNSLNAVRGVNTGRG
jgi:hypothetical protein